VKLRGPTLDDVPAIAELIERHAQEVFGESEVSGDELRHWFGLPNIWMRVAEEDGRLQGYLDVLKPSDEAAWDIYVCVVLPEAAHALLAAVEEHAAEGVLHVVSQGADPLLPGLLGAEGWLPVRHTFRMLIEFDGDLPEPVWPEGIAVRPFRPGEERRVYEANNTVFDNGWFFEPYPFEEWLELHRGPSFDPSLWWLAEDGDELSGFSLNTWSLSGDPRYGRVGSLGVLPDYRHRGLGEALLRHSFRDFRKRGATRVGLGVDAQNETGAVRLYERVGMHVDRRNTTYEKVM